jgi:hypothetical protein
MGLWLLLIALIVSGYYTAGIDFSRPKPRSVVLKPFGVLPEDTQPLAFWVVALGLVLVDLILFIAIIFWFINQ